MSAKGFCSVITNKLFLVLLGITLPFLQGCSVNPATGDNDFVLMSEEGEISAGHEQAIKILEQYPIYKGQKVQSYVQRVGQKVASNSHRSSLKYQFTVIDTPDINAFALPGGFIYIHRGLLAYLNSEAELAAVLAHEIGHVTARHGVRQYSMELSTQILTQLVGIYAGGLAANLTDLASDALLSGYGRDHELEADGFGAQYLANSGYDPQAMIEIIDVLKQQETFSYLKAEDSGQKVANYHGLFSTHPRNDERLQQVVGQVTTIAGGKVGRDSFLQAIDGIAFGNSEDQGIIDGRNFLHKPLGIKLEYPEGWSLQNQPKQLLAQAPGERAFLVMQMGEIKDGFSPEEYLQDMIQRSRMWRGEELRGPGYAGYSAVVSASRRSLYRVAVIYYRGDVYEFIGSTKRRGEFNDYDQSMKDIIASFGKLPPSDYEKAEGLHIKLVRARSGDTYTTLSASSPITQYADQQLRLLNDDYPEGEPAPGELIKVVY